MHLSLFALSPVLFPPPWYIRLRDVSPTVVCSSSCPTLVSAFRTFLEQSPFVLFSSLCTTSKYSLLIFTSLVEIDPQNSQMFFFVCHKWDLCNCCRFFFFFSRYASKYVFNELTLLQKHHVPFCPIAMICTPFCPIAKRAREVFMYFVAWVHSHSLSQPTHSHGDSVAFSSS